MPTLSWLIQDNVSIALYFEIKTDFWRVVNIEHSYWLWGSIEQRYNCHSTSDKCDQTWAPSGYQNKTIVWIVIFFFFLSLSFFSIFSNNLVRQRLYLKTSRQFEVGLQTWDLSLVSIQATKHATREHATRNKTRCRKLSLPRRLP